MKKLTVVSYNVLHGKMVREDLGIIGRELKRLGADLVGLQEIDMGTDRMNGLDTLAIIAGAGEYPYAVFTPAMQIFGGAYGTAILSKYPITSFETIPLVGCEEIEPRAIGHAIVDVEGARLDFFNTHLSVESKEAQRLQLEQLRMLTGACERLIMTGDFNTEDLEMLSVLAPLTTVNPRSYSTHYPSESAIDHIFLSQGILCGGTEMPRIPYSDHYPLLARVAF